MNWLHNNTKDRVRPISSVYQNYDIPKKIIITWFGDILIVWTVYYMYLGEC